MVPHLIFCLASIATASLGVGVSMPVDFHATQQNFTVLTEPQDQYGTRCLKKHFVNRFGRQDHLQAYVDELSARPNEPCTVDNVFFAQFPDNADGDTRYTLLKSALLDEQMRDKSVPCSEIAETLSTFLGDSAVCVETDNRGELSTGVGVVSGITWPLGNTNHVLNLAGGICEEALKGTGKCLSDQDALREAGSSGINPG